MRTFFVETLLECYEALACSAKLGAGGEPCLLSGFDGAVRVRAVLRGLSRLDPPVHIFITEVIDRFCSRARTG